MSTDTIKDQGTISFWLNSYGFIKPDGRSQTGEIFFHQKNVTGGQDFVGPGMRVSYDLAPDRRNPEKKVMAVNVEVLGGTFSYV